jgi:hypothetical protein
MTLKKALYGRQPDCFCFDFLCPLAVTRDFSFCFTSGIFNKVSSFTHFGLKKLPKYLEQEIPARVCSLYKFFDFSVSQIELKVEL